MASNPTVGYPAGFPNQGQPFVGQAGLIERVWLLLLVNIWNRSGGATGGSIVPIGTVLDFAGPEAPAGFIECGQSVSRATYAGLFNVIGTTWGPGDGTATFDLPPQNVFAKGVGPAQAVGDIGGSSTLALTIAELPAHHHAVTDPGHTHVVTDPGHIHAITDPGHVHTSLVNSNTNTAGAAAGATTAGNTGNAVTGISVNSHTTGVTNQISTTGVTTQDTGTGAPVSILPPFGAFLKVIKY